MSDTKRQQSAKTQIDEKKAARFYPWRVPDLAQVLRKPRQWIYDRKDKIPHRRLGRELCFDPEEIQKWLGTLPGCPLKTNEGVQHE